MARALQKKNKKNADLPFNTVRIGLYLYCRKKKMSDDYIQCRNCGHYIEQINAVNKLYCSEACAHRFNACVICGKYFVQNKGFSDKICSPECSIEYKITKLYTTENEENP
jgi:hypothetical protein